MLTLFSQKIFVSMYMYPIYVRLATELQTYFKQLFITNKFISQDVSTFVCNP